MVCSLSVAHWQHRLQWSPRGAPSGGTSTGVGGAATSVGGAKIVGESVEGLTVGACEVCVLSIPAFFEKGGPGGGAAVLLTVHMPYRSPRPGTCDGGRRGFQEILRVVGVGRLVLARLVQVAVTFSRIVRVPRTYKAVVCGTLVAARVERARRSLAGSAGFHVLVVGLGAPAFVFVRSPAEPQPRRRPNRLHLRVGQPPLLWSLSQPAAPQHEQ